MLGKAFVALSSIPSLKKRMWRGWYQYLSGSYRDSDWTFMNYGYAGPDAEVPRLEESDEPDRFCIQLYHHVASAVDLRGRDVLEVGSGRGGGASFIKRYLHPARMISVDISPNAVSLCRRMHQIDGLEFQVGDAERLPFDHQTFDAVINVESSHCYPARAKFFREVGRVLRTGGHFLYADLHPGGTLDSWRDDLTAAGFECIQERDITPNVLAALDADSDRKQALIARLLPAMLRGNFADFAAIRGSSVYEAFRSGRLVYRSFALRRAP